MSGGSNSEILGFEPVFTLAKQVLYSLSRASSLISDLFKCL
jgi:hypothetical protein